MSRDCEHDRRYARKRWKTKYYQDPQKYRDMAKNNRIKYDSYYKKYFNEISITSRRVYCALKNSAKRREILFNLEKDEFCRWYDSRLKVCFYCRIGQEELLPINNMNLKQKRLGIDRKDNDVPYQIDNIVLACARCNAIKGSWFTQNQMFEIAVNYLQQWEFPEISKQI